MRENTARLTKITQMKTKLENISLYTNTKVKKIKGKFKMS